MFRPQPPRNIFKTKLSVLSGSRLPRNQTKETYRQPEEQRSRAAAATFSVLPPFVCFQPSRCVSTHPDSFTRVSKLSWSGLYVCVCVCVMCSSAQLSHLWASSRWVASFQDPLKVQGLKAVKHRWQTFIISSVGSLAGSTGIFKDDALELHTTIKNNKRGFEKRKWTCFRRLRR